MSDDILHHTYKNIRSQGYIIVSYINTLGTNVPQPEVSSQTTWHIRVLLTCILGFCSIKWLGIFPCMGCQLFFASCLTIHHFPPLISHVHCMQRNTAKKDWLCALDFNIPNKNLIISVPGVLPHSVVTRHINVCNEQFVFKLQIEECSFLSSVMHSMKCIAHMCKTTVTLWKTRPLNNIQYLLHNI